MKRIIFTIIIALTTYTSFSQDTIAQQLDNLITIYHNWNKFNGSVLIAQKEKILLEKGYGYKNVQAKTVNDAHTVFQIGSLTKEFTATIILKLAEQKKLFLTDKLNKYYPDFPKGDSITIINLLTHSSGIFNYTQMDNFWDHLSKHTNEDEVVNFFKNKPLEFTPGTKFSYSNSGYMLLAYIIQKVTGRSYETVVHNWIFKPLNMEHTGFDFTGLKSTEKANGYTDFNAAKTTQAPENDSTQFIGSGEIYSTVEDLYKWHTACQNNQIISKASWQQAYVPNDGGYGYGWELDTMFGKNVIGHKGRMFGFTCKMVRIPSDNIFIILLNNNSDDPYLETINKKILNILYNRPDTLPAQPLKFSEEKLKSFTGTYAFDSIHVMEVKLINGHLFGGESGNYLEWMPISDNHFRFMKEEVIEGDIEFAVDDNGIVNELHIIRKSGQIFRAKKVK